MIANKPTELSEEQKADKQFQDECRERFYRLKPAFDLLKANKTVEIRSMLARRPDEELKAQLNEAVQINKYIEKHSRRGVER